MTSHVRSPYETYTQKPHRIQGNASNTGKHQNRLTVNKLSRLVCIQSGDAIRPKLLYISSMQHEDEHS